MFSVNQWKGPFFWAAIISVLSSGWQSSSLYIKLHMEQALSVNAATSVLINEIVTDPQQDWSSNGFNGEPGAGTISNVDEYVELLILTDHLDLTGWTIELIDGIDFSGDLSATGAFDVSLYFSATGGTFTQTKAGDILLLANPVGSHAMNNDVNIILKDDAGIIVDEVKLGGKEGEAPNGNANDISNEAVLRSPEGNDTNNDENDFSQGVASPGKRNDLESPVVTNVSSTATDGVYKAGELIVVTVLFSENVTVTGTPQLELETGTTDPTVNYTSGSGGSTLTFNYIVQAGDVSADLDYTGTTALSLNSGTINDGAGNAATLILATPGAANSLGNNKSIVIDGVAPTITTLSPTDDNTAVSLVPTLTITFSEAVSLGTGNIQIIDLDDNSSTVTIDAANPGSQASIAGAVLALNPSTALELSTNYAVQIAGSALVDSAGNNFAGIADNTTYNFTTVNTSIQFTSTASNGAESVSASNIQVELNAVSALDVTADYTVTGTATGNGTDYTLANGTITITSGNTTANINLTGIVDDALDEDNETVILTLSSPTNAGLGANTVHTYTINDDDPTPTVAFNATASNGDESTASTNIQVDLGAVSGRDVTVDYAITGTATGSGTDYTLANGTLTINAGASSANITLAGIVDDALDEDNETVILTLSNPSNASLGTNTVHTYTINDNDATPDISFNATASNGDESTVSTNIQVDLGAVSGRDVTVDYSVTGTAIGSGTDYTLANGTLIVTAGNASNNISIAGIVNDALDEDNETVVLTLSNPSNATLGTNTVHTYTITDNDPTPTVTFVAASNNGLESVASANVALSLSAVAGRTVTVDYALTGTVDAADFTKADGTITFNPGEINKSIDLTGIVDDGIVEADETIIVTLSNPSNSTLGVTTLFTYTITDNDAATVTIADVSSDENGGDITVTASLDNAVDGGFTVNASTADGIATTADSDYTAVTSQTLTFAGTAGETRSFTITPTADTKLEANETLTVAMGALNPATVPVGDIDITDGATITITNDDVASVTIADISGNEDDGAITITATLDNAVQGGFTVEVNTADGTAEAGTDYTAVAGQVLTFSGIAGETETFTVTPTNDGLEEAAGTITVSMSNLAATTLSVTITDQATVTIIDDDDNTAPAGYTVTMDDVSIGGSELTTSTFTFTGAEVGATYNYTVSSNGGGTNVTGTGTIATAKDKITLADLSGLGDGTLTLSVTLTDASSNTGTAAISGAQLDTTVPNAPIVSSITADAGVNGADGITNDNTLSINGTAEANSTVEVFIDGVSIGTTSANGDREFSIDHTGTSLNDGAYAITAQATDAAGNTGNTSIAVNITVDTTAPAAPVVSAISTDSGSSATDGVTSDQTLIITGTAEANSTVEVFIGGTSIGSTTASGAGAWSFDHSGTTLAEATYAITATATDAAGNTSAASSAFSAIIDTTAPVAPTVDLDATSDLGVSDTDNLTNDNTPTVRGIAEANATVTILVDENAVGTSTANGSGEWTFTIPTNLTAGERSVTATATDAAGNVSTSSASLTVTIDTSIAAPILSPADNATGVLPSANLIMTFAEQLNKGTGNITIKQVSDDAVLETIDVTSANVTVSGGTVTIDPTNLMLPPSTEFYVNVDAGVLTDDAGNSYTGISNKTDWSFTIIDASVVTSVAVPNDGVYAIGDELEFTVTFNLPVTITGTPSITVTVGSTTKNATLKATVSNSPNAVFSFRVAEGDLDADGIAVGNTIALNSGTIKDEFNTDAILTLNSIGSTANINVDGIRPTPTLSSTIGNLTNGAFTVTFTYDEVVSGLTASDIAITNGTASNFTSVTAGTVWTAEITPTTDGPTTVTLPAGVATDTPGNASAAATNTISTNFDGTAPVVISIARTDANQLNNADADANFTVRFSENVTGVDVTDFEVVTTGTATGTLNTVSPIDAKTYTINVNGISGQGTVGLNAKDDDTIIDAATNPLGSGFAGEVYTINWMPRAISLTSSVIKENNSVGDEVGTFNTTDQDAGDSHSYSLVAGAGDADNTSFTINGSSLTAAEIFDFEAKDSYSLRLRTDDGNGGIFEQVLTVSIENSLEPSIILTGDGDFGEVILGFSASKTWSAINNGETRVEVRLASSAAGFKIEPLSLILDVGETREVTASFTPQAEGEVAGTINVDYVGINEEGERISGTESEQVSGTGVIVTHVPTTLAAQDLLVYPNPTTAIVHVDLTKFNGQSLDVSLVNSAGQVINYKSGVKALSIAFDVSGLEGGIYLIRVQNQLGAINKKFMVEH